MGCIFCFVQASGKKKTKNIYPDIPSVLQVADIQAQSSRLEVQTAHLTSDLKQCRLNSSLTVAEASRQLQLKQQEHDSQVDKLLCVGGWMDVIKCIYLGVTVAKNIITTILFVLTLACIIAEGIL